MTAPGAATGSAWIHRGAFRGTLVFSVLMVGFLLSLGSPARAAEAPAPWWRVSAETAPSNLPPEHEGEKAREGEGEIVVVASNLGDGPASGSSGEPVVIADKLPAGLKATAITGQTKHNKYTPSCSLATLRCTYTGVLYPYERLAITIKVKVEEPPGTVTTLPDEMNVEGGGATRPASTTQRIAINGAPTPFGVQTSGYELAPFNQDGTPATQAGAHPFQLTSTLTLNQTGAAESRQPAALPRNLRFPLPLGLIGDPNATEQCPTTDFTAHAPVSEVDLCPPSSVVGVASLTIDEPETVHVVTVTVPLFNLVPSEGEPARFGIEALGLVPVIIDTAVSPSDDYQVVASVKNATAITGLLSTQVTFWGVPGDPRHNPARGWECVAGSLHYEKGELNTPCPTSTNLPETPLLTLPTSCAADPATEPVSFPIEAESWAERGFVTSPPYQWSGPLEEPLGFTDCQALPFQPRIGVAPEARHSAAVHSGSSPTGLTATVKLPQAPTIEPNPDGHAEADVRDTTVTLPAGVQLNPSAANGLQACPEAPEGAYEGIGFEGFEKFIAPDDATSAIEPGAETAAFSSPFRFSGETVEGHELPPSCPDASKVGVVRIKTPLLPKELEGAVYLAEPAPNGESGRNPFNSLIALYIVAEDREAGVLVKLAGKGELNQSTGQVTTTFQSTPQLPFEELRLELFGGERASLSTPARCGQYATAAAFTPWSGTEAVPTSSSPSEFAVTSGPGGGPCPSGALPFSPAFVAQSSSTQAGGFSPFVLGMTRPDGDQALTGLSVHLAPGMAALLSSVTPCQEPPTGQEWNCGPESLIGHSTAESGVGNEPVSLPGDVYLTTGYDGAPFGVLDSTEAKAGPFDLGKVNVRSRVDVNTETAAVTITVDPGPRGEQIPTMLKGVPVQLKALRVDVDREGFEFNPTNCAPTSITGTLSGNEGASSGVSSPFQVGGCQNLPFKPMLTATAAGHGSKTEGTTFDVKLTSAGLGQANIQKVDLQLPVALSTRNTTLNKACLEAAFNANPASCGEGSIIGLATIHTPVLKSPLTGPAYLVSHGGAGFPDVEFVLQGEGISLILDGKTDIKAGVTYSKFEAAPDAPFTTFETELPAGPHSILTPNVPEKEDFSLCSQKLAMPTKIVAQDGAVIEQSTPIAISGCGSVLASKSRKPTRAQLLAKALKSCKSKYKHRKSRRLACEKQARKKYGPAKKKAHKTSHAGSRKKA